MDATTIQEIANQLGIAADKVTTDIIPQYAQACLVTDWIVLGATFAITLICFIAFIIAKCIAPRYSDAPGVLRMITIIVGIAFLIIALFEGVDITAWTNWPEARFLSSVIN